MRYSVSIEYLLHFLKSAGGSVIVTTDSEGKLQAEYGPLPVKDDYPYLQNVDLYLDRLTVSELSRFKKIYFKHTGRRL